ncbi:MAG: aspartate ammonia-lyase [Deltaproteobacteria bacterium]|nr:aspartate ammonia-lyase [Deltaproteobacteria bacterium]MBI3387443.1 aspartate ammonia-lyase [Deltaproteobacteria bacterium]
MASATRIERDLIGELALPADALFGIHSQRALLNCSFSQHRLSDYPVYVRSLAQVKRAAARANRTAGVLDERLANAIEAACETLIAGRYLDQFPVDLLAGGGGIAVNMNVNEVIANLANEALGGRRGVYDPVHPKQHVNASQSTADVCHTATRLALLDQWVGLQRALDACGVALRAKATEFAPVMTLSRTCLQDGLAVSMGELFGGYAALLGRRTTELARTVEALRQVNLGGTVIGSGDGAPDAYRAAVLPALNDITGQQLTARENLYDAAQNIDDLASVSTQLALLADSMMKIAQDLRLLSSGPDGGFGELRLPAVQEGSSFFAAKINPVVPETMLQCGFQVLACDRAVQLALERGELHLNVFEGVAAVNLFDAFAMLTNGVTLFAERCVSGIRVNEERCRALAAFGKSTIQR